MDVTVSVISQAQAYHCNACEGMLAGKSIHRSCLSTQESRSFCASCARPSGRRYCPDRSLSRRETSRHKDAGFAIGYAFGRSGLEPVAAWGMPHSAPRRCCLHALNRPPDVDPEVVPSQVQRYNPLYPPDRDPRARLCTSSRNSTVRTLGQDMVQPTYRWYTSCRLPEVISYEAHGR